MSADWQVGPNIKDSPGSQGTLFRGGTQFMSDRRFPRHYTPQRQQEVAEAVIPSGQRQYGQRGGAYRPNGNGGATFVPGRGITDPYFRNYPVGSNIERIHGNDVPESRRRLVDNLSRSTAPVEHLQAGDLHWTVGQQQLTVNAAGVYRAGGTESPGVYRPDTIGLIKGAESDDTAIHELGHHVSHAVENTEHSQHYGRGPQTMGTEEGYADRYAFEHFRDRRGQKPDWYRVYNPHPHQSEGGMKRASFQMGYWNGRGTDVPAPPTTTTSAAPREAIYPSLEQRRTILNSVPEGQERLFTTVSEAKSFETEDVMKRGFRFANPDTMEEIGHSPGRLRGFKRAPHFDDALRQAYERHDAANE